MRHKKSQIEVANVLIIALVIAIVLIAAVTSFLSSLGSKGDIETCRLSILAAYRASSVADITQLDLVKNFNTKLRCVAPYTRIGADEKNQKLAERQVMSKVAEEMRSCWYKMGAGDLSFFTTKVAIPRICIVCSEFTLDRGIVTNDMLSFLNEANIPQTKEKYIDYLDVDRKDALFLRAQSSNKIVANDLLIKTTKQEIKQNMENIYSVVYLRAGYSAWVRWATLAGWAIGAVSHEEATKSTAEREFQTIFVIPKEDIAKTKDSKMCEQLFYQKQDTGWLFK